MAASHRLQLDSAAIADLSRGPMVEDLADEVGAQVADRARELAPKRTGKGASNIAHQVGEDVDGVFVDVGYKPDGFYMAFQELGTEHNPPRPHLRPAIDAPVDL